MNENCNKQLVACSQSLRRNMPREERKLWYEYLKSLSVQFYRQKVMGAHIVDFCAPSARLVIEISGGEEAAEAILLRDKYLKAHGYRVLRYARQEVLCGFECVCNDIANELRQIKKEQRNKQRNKENGY